MSPIIGNPLKDLPTGSHWQPPRRGARIQAPGLVARFQPIRGITPKHVLSSRIYLPALLNGVTLTESALHNEYDTLSAGQFSQAAMGGPDVQSQLRDLPLDSLTVAWDPKWMVVTRQNPHHVRTVLFAIMRSRKPVHLLIVFHPHPNPWPEIDMKVTLRQGTRELRQQENDTHYMTFTLKEWRDPTVARHSSRPKGGGHPRKRGTELPTTKKLTGSDSLDSLSKEFYGTYRHWRLIRDANGIPKRWGQKSPLVRLIGRFKPGSKIKIPKLPEAAGGSH